MLPVLKRSSVSVSDRISDSQVMVSPAKTGAGKAISEKPRFATSVPWVSCATDRPTRVESVYIEFTRR